MARPGSSAEAERIHSSSVRLAEVRKRLERLRAGEASTPEDVERARASAVAQQVAASEAYRRLLHAHASALKQQPQGVDKSRDRRLHREIERLRGALVAMQTYGSKSRVDWPEEQRRRVWEAVVAECSSDNWRSWAYAVCVVAAKLSGVRGAALSLYDARGVPSPLAESDRWTGRVEEIHQLLGEGPALAAFNSRQPVLLDDLTTVDGRWPGFTSSAADLGVQACWSFPIPMDSRIIGSLTYYRTRREARPWTSRRDAELLAGVASQALLADLDALLDESIARQGDRSSNLNVAAGVLSVRCDISVAEALAHIRARAFSTGQGLTSTAQSVLDGTFEP